MIIEKAGPVLDKFKPDIAHIRNYNFQLTTSILEELKKRNIKIVHTIHDSQLICQCIECILNIKMKYVLNASMANFKNPVSIVV